MALIYFCLLGLAMLVVGLSLALAIVLGYRAILAALRRRRIDVSPARKDRIATIAFIAGFVVVNGALIAVALNVPDPARLRVMTAQVLGHESTHITLELSQADAASQAALIEWIQPLMQTHERTFSYWMPVGNRRAVMRSGKVTATLRSRYRQEGDQLHIVLARPLEPDSRFRHLLQLLARPPPPALPEEVWADVVADGVHQMEVALLPATAETVHLAPSRAGRLVGREAPARCALRIQGLVSTDLFNLPSDRPPVSPDAERRLTLRTLPDGLRDGTYRLDALGNVPGQDGRLHRTWHADRTRIHMRFDLAPPLLDMTGDDCEMRLLQHLDPFWLQLEMHRLRPALASAVQGVRFDDGISRRWPGPKGWIDAAPAE